MLSSGKVRATTIADVAVEAGVSPATVSRVMNANDTVDPKIAARVRAAALALNYSPSPLARSLVLGRTQTIAFVAPDLGNPTFHGAMRGLSQAAAEHGYRLLVAETSEMASEEAILAVETRRRCDGIVLCAPRMPEDELVTLTAQLTPIVLINRSSTRVSVPVLEADYQSGIYNLAQHLHELGHRKLVYVDGAVNSASNSYRRRGLDLFAADFPDVQLKSIRGGVMFADGHAVADAVIASGATGVLAFNDLVAMGLLSALHEKGVDVPGQLSVTGFDDIPFARYTTPPLTTASVPVEELGRQAWRRLWSLLNGEVPDYNISIGPRLEVRGSTAPVAS